MDKLAQKRMILSDNLWKVMWDLSWPAVIAMVLYGLNMVFDAIFVGKFVGETALAGVSIAYPLSALTLGLGSLIGVGAGSLLSISIGANDLKTQERLLGNVNYITVIITIIYMIAGLAFANPLVKMMGGIGQPHVFGVSYFRITVIGAFFWIYGLSGNLIVRAEGKMKSAAVMMGAGLLINIFFNYIFIVVFNFGVAGAAWGTNIGMLVYTLAGLFYFKGSRVSFPARPFSLCRDKDIEKSIISMGMPSLIMSVMTLIQAIVVFNALSKYGSTYDLAFYGVVYRIFNLLLTPIFGLMRALQPVIGINFGAGQNRRVIGSFWVFMVASMILILPFWVIMMAAPGSVLGLMFTTSTIDAASLVNFRIFISILPLLPLMFMAMTFFPAIDNGKPAALMGMIRQVVFYIPVMLILPRMFGVRWVYLGSLCIDVIMIAYTLFLVLREFKRLKTSSAIYV